MARITSFKSGKEIRTEFSSQYNKVYTGLDFYDGYIIETTISRVQQTGGNHYNVYVTARCLGGLLFSSRDMWIDTISNARGSRKSKVDAMIGKIKNRLVKKLSE